MTANRPRPYIPLSIRVQVAERQCAEFGWTRDLADQCQNASKWLAVMLGILFGDQPRHLDHNPPLRQRPYNPKIKDIAARYTPNANDPDALKYLAVVEHKIKTNVRGDHGQFPDRVLIKRERRRERKAAPKRQPFHRSPRELPRVKIAARANPWPPKGARPFRGRNR